jgi:hypothetical protein
MSPNFEQWGMRWPQRGSCSGTTGQSNGALQTPFGVGNGQISEGVWRTSEFANAFWASRDVNLPPKTTWWTWGVLGAFSRGSDALGASFYGAIAPSSWNRNRDFPNQFPNQWDQWDALTVFPVSQDIEYKYSMESGGPRGMYCWSSVSGPMETFPEVLGYFDSVEELIADLPTGEVGDQYDVDGLLYIWDATSSSWEYVSPGDDRIACTYGWSSTLLSGNKGRIVMGTFGSEALGTRFSFDLGIVVSGTHPLVG